MALHAGTQNQFFSRVMKSLCMDVFWHAHGRILRQEMRKKEAAWPVERLLRGAGHTRKMAGYRELWRQYPVIHRF
ncbi:hypothetical protein [Zobellella sp. DQSA1]|uniref:hypothetical protein n=1 Tax=Zobellella sp. DQSA1 TaxID=3342386 RepID=UPI0035C0BFF0